MRLPTASILAVILLTTTTAFAQPRPRPELRRLATTEERADALMRSLLPALTDCQEDYLKSHPGSYWQGLITHSTPPADDVRSPADNLGRKPGDVPLTWTQFIAQCPRRMPPLPAQWPVSLRVDVYTAPRGAGWTLTQTYAEGRTTYERTVNVVGPARRRTSDWQEVVEIEE